MKQARLTMVTLFLVFVAAAYVYKQGWIGAERATSIETSDVAWDVKSAEIKQEATVTFTMRNAKGSELRGLTDEEHQQVRAVIVTPDLKAYEEVQPSFRGKGVFTFPYTFSKQGEYGVILYRKETQAQQSFASTRVSVGQATKETSLKPDALLTTKIGPYETSLIFHALQPNREETLTFEFLHDMRFRSVMKEPASILLIHEEKEYLVYAIAKEEKGKQLSFTLTFPKEGMYKMWGVFYLDGKKYTKEMVLQVGKPK